MPTQSPKTFISITDPALEVFAPIVTITNPIPGNTYVTQIDQRIVKNYDVINNAPGGTSNEVQFRSGSTFGGDAGLTYNANTDTLTVGFIVGNGAGLTNLVVAGSAFISNGTSNVNIATANGNVTIAVGGSANVAVFSTTGANLTALNVTGTTTLKKIAETVVAGTYAATLTPDLDTGTIFNYTLTGNVTLSSFANAVPGVSATVILTQDGVGSRTLTSTMKFAEGLKTLSTAAGSIDTISVFYDGTTYYASLVLGYA